MGRGKETAVMGRPSKYPPELRRRAIEEVIDRGRKISEVAAQLGIGSPETLRNWGRCCVEPVRHARNACARLPGLDRPDQFGERIGDATMHARVDTQFIVTAADVLHERVATDDRACGPVAFQTAHRSEPRFQSAVVVLDPVVGVLLRVVKRAREKLIDHHTERRGTIGDDLDRFAVSAWSAVVKNRRAAFVSRFAETYTSRICPY